MGFGVEWGLGGGGVLSFAFSLSSFPRAHPLSIYLALYLYLYLSISSPKRTFVSLAHPLASQTRYHRALPARGKAHQEGTVRKEEGQEAEEAREKEREEEEDKACVLLAVDRD